MKLKIADALVALLLLTSSVESLHQYSNLSMLSILFAIFYFVSGFAVLRSYSWTRYILYINSAILLLITIVGLYLTNFEALYIGILPFVLALFFGLYGYYRYRSKNETKPFNREILIFTVSLIAFSIFSVAVDHFLLTSGDAVTGTYRLE